MSLTIYVDGVAVSPEKIIFEPGISGGGVASFRDLVPAGSTISFDYIVKSAISAENYAVIDEVIIDSVARGYVQRRRDGID